MECPPGYACNGGVKSACGSGEWALAGATTCSTYQAGTQKNDGAKEVRPQECPSGYYTDGAQTCKLCEDGYECPDGANRSSCGGDYCPAGTSSRNGCEDYQDCTNWSNNCAWSERVNGSGNCVTCEKDVTCLLRGQTTTPVDSANGYYSPTGHNVEYLCPGGMDCTDADNV